MSAHDGSTRDPGTHDSVLRVLDYVLRLELTGGRWERVDGILTLAADAAAAGDLAVLQATANELRAVGPVRIIRIGGTPVGPPPVKVRERVELVRAAIMAARGAEDDDGEGNYDDQRPAARG
jgi:hypothetical protein